MATTNPIQLVHSSSLLKCVRYQSRGSLNNINGGHNSSIASGSGSGSGKGEIRKPVVAVKASTFVTANHVTTSTSSPPDAVVIRQGLSNLAAFISVILPDYAVKWTRPWNHFHPQMFLERAIIDCRFFTLLAVAGSLLGSVLCFLEGCVLVMESYAHYLHTLMSQRVDQGHVVHLLIQAIDMFLVGTALLVFGVGLYIMFVRSTTATKANQQRQPNLLGLFYVKSSPPRWVGMQSIGQAKSKIGHTVMMILQVGLLDKFKDIPLATGFDLACFAAAVLISSASIFVLSRLHKY